MNLEVLKILDLAKARSRISLDMNLEVLKIFDLAKARSRISLDKNLNVLNFVLTKIA